MLVGSLNVPAGLRSSGIQRIVLILATVVAGPASVSLATGSYRATYIYTSDITFQLAPRVRHGSVGPLRAKWVSALAELLHQA
jgi:hypothetical protein